MTAERTGEGSGLAVIVAARDEADRIGPTLGALRRAFPEASIWVADDASRDGTGDLALAAGGQVVRRGRPHGKGGNVGATAEAVLSSPPPPGRVLLCDADLGESAGRLTALVAAVDAGECDLAVAAFSRRAGGGFGIAVGWAGRMVRRATGFEPRAPISGQRAMRVEVLRATLPFAPGYGMEVGMTIDALRSGYRLREYELDLEHRATGRTPAGFLHRGRQLADIARAYLSRRRGRVSAPGGPS